MSDGISLISTIIMAIATTVLAGATIYYAIMNRRLWLNMEKQVMRPRKAEEIKYIIKPLLKQCELENKYLYENSYRWFSKGITLGGKFYSDSTLRVVFNAFIRGESMLKESIEEHDELVGRLKDKFDSFVDSVNTDIFHSEIENLIIEFDMKRGKKTKKINKSTINHYCRMIIDCLIENIDLNNNNLSGEDASFWKDYGNNFLKMRTEKTVNSYLNDLEALSDQLKEIIFLIKGRTENIYREYRKDGLAFGLS